MGKLSDPEDFIVQFADLLPAGADVLDAAAGSGRHAVFLTRRSCRVLAVERDPANVEEMRRQGVEAVVGDIERTTLLPNRLDAVVNTFFLFRRLLVQYAMALRPNGLIFFRTYTTDHMDLLGRESPRREFLLQPGELKRAFAAFHLLFYEEAVEEDRAIATLVARKP